MPHTPRPFTGANERHYIAGRTMARLAKRYPKPIKFSALAHAFRNRPEPPNPADVGRLVEALAGTDPPLVEIIRRCGGRSVRLTPHGLREIAARTRSKGLPRRRDP